MRGPRIERLALWRAYHREGTMANQRETRSVLVIGVLTLVVAGTGLYLGFQKPRSPNAGQEAPKVPDQGPIIYEMRSVRSEPEEAIA